MGTYLAKYPDVTKVGIGLPGLISKDRTTTLEIPAIPELNGYNLKKNLSEEYPNVSFYLENDASAAALGELKFGTSNPSQDFLFITMGTGIGSALVDDGKIFKVHAVTAWKWATCCPEETPDWKPSLEGTAS